MSESGGFDKGQTSEWRSGKFIRTVKAIWGRFRLKCVTGMGRRGCLLMVPGSLSSFSLRLLQFGTVFVDGAVNALIAANSSDTALASDWKTLSSTYQSAEQTLVPDLTNVVTDLESLSTAA